MPTAPTFGAAGTRSAANSGTSVAPALPTGITAGMGLLAVCSVKNNAAISVSSGWNIVRQDNSGASFTACVAWRIATGTDTAPTFSWTGSAGNQGQVFRYSNTDPNAQFVGQIALGTGSASPHATNGFGATSRLNSLFIYVDQASAATALTAPSGWTSDSTGTGNTLEISVGHFNTATPNVGQTSGNISSTGAAAAYVEYIIELLATPVQELFPAPARGNGIPRINWDHPLAERLQFFAYDLGNGNYIDLVSGTLGTHVTGATKAGNGAHTLGTGTGWNNSDGVFWNCPSYIQTSTGNGNWTAAVGYIPPAGAVNINGVIFGRMANNNGSAPFVNWDFETNGQSHGRPEISCSFNNGGALNTFNWEGAAASIYHHLAQVASGGNTTTYYAQGVQWLTAGGETVQSVNSGDQIFISGATSGSVKNPLAATSFVPWGAYWGRNLNASEIYSHYAAPYQMLIFPGDVVRDATQAGLDAPVKAPATSTPWFDFVVEVDQREHLVPIPY